MQETITLSTGEVLVVERSTSPAGSLYINLWASSRNEIANQEEAEIRKVRLSESKFESAMVSLRNRSMRVSEMFRHIEIAQHAARLAAELDAEYLAGTEVEK